MALRSCYAQNAAHEDALQQGLRMKNRVDIRDTPFKGHMIKSLEMTILLKSQTDVFRVLRSGVVNHMKKLL